MKEVPGDKSAPAEKHDKGKARHDRRRHRRKESHYLKEPLAWHIRIMDAVCKEKPEDDGTECCHEGRIQRMREGKDKFFFRQRTDPVTSVRDQQYFHKWINDKNSKQQKYNGYADKERRLP